MHVFSSMCPVKLRSLPSQLAPPGHFTCTMMSIPPQVSSAAGGWTKVLLEVSSCLSYPTMILLFLPRYRTLHLPLLNLCFWPNGTEPSNMLSDACPTVWCWMQTCWEQTPPGHQQRCLNWQVSGQTPELYFCSIQNSVDYIPLTTAF